MATLAAPAPGLLLGYAADLVVADPLRAHPVAGFGQAAARLEGALYADSRRRGTLFVAVCLGVVSGSSWLLVRTVNTGGPGATGRPASGRANARGLAALTAVATWSVVGGESLARVATRLRRHLADGDIEGARALLPSLCGRDPNALDAAGLARAAVESVAENTTDAVVAPLVWGGARRASPGCWPTARSTRSTRWSATAAPRYERFGWAAARARRRRQLACRARLTGAAHRRCSPRSSAAAARGAARCCAATAPRHPSPNAGRMRGRLRRARSAYGSAGSNVYGGRVEHRPALGDGRGPESGRHRAAPCGCPARSAAVLLLAVAVARAVGVR